MLATAHEAGLLNERRDPRKLVAPRPPTAALEYLLYLLREVAIEGSLLLAEHPEDRERLVVFIARAGALYPFFRTSALLKHVADHTEKVPVILLYPGHPVEDTGLSFMGKLPADRDYRPRIYR